MSIVFVVDTSYLSELFRVPGWYDDDKHALVLRKFQQAFADNHGVIVPLPCIYELAKHISQVQDGNARRSISLLLADSIRKSIKEQFPWTITPYEAIESLPDLFDDYCNHYVISSISFTDAAVINEANRIKLRYGNLKKVHIWTLDVDLKSREPDVEV